MKSLAQQITELQSPVTFWADVKKIIPDNTEDWEIKQLQVLSEKHYKKLLNDWTDILSSWTNISHSFDEIEKIITFIKENKKTVIEKINSL